MFWGKQNTMCIAYWCNEILYYLFLLQYMFWREMDLCQSSKTCFVLSWRGLTLHYFWWESVHLSWRLLLHSGQSGKKGELRDFMPLNRIHLCWLNVYWICFDLLMFFRMKLAQSLLSLPSWCHVHTNSLTLVWRPSKSWWTMTETMWVEHRLFKWGLCSLPTNC